MLKHKKKKVVKQRGSKTHGWGAMKKHRGKGNKGGAGMAGTGARADTKKPTILKKYGKDYFGKRGFKSLKKIKSKPKKTINLSTIESNFDYWIESGAIKKENNKYILDLKEFGYDKLLGMGTISKPLEIKINEASKLAIEKVEKVGGKVIVE